jgi:hypothetical protein
MGGKPVAGFTPSTIARVAEGAGETNKRSKEVEGEVACFVELGRVKKFFDIFVTARRRGGRRAMAEERSVSELESILAARDTCAGTSHTERFASKAALARNRYRTDVGVQPAIW